MQFFLLWLQILMGARLIPVSQTLIPSPFLSFLLFTELCGCSEVWAHGLDVKPIKKKPTVKLKCPAGLWKGRICIISRVFFQPLPAALLYPNHRFLTPCYHFLVRALTTAPSLRSSVLSARIYHPPAAGRCFWVASLSGRRWKPATSLATAANDLF